MKLRFIFILLFVFGVGAQRRNSKPETETETSSHRPVGRGRARFSISAEALEEIRTDSDRSPSVKSESKKKVERRISRPNSRPYEVEEIVDDIPNENARKLHKPRVITETRFEAVNAPKKPLFIPVPLPEEELSPEELLASFGPPIANTEKTTESVKKTHIPIVQVSSASPIVKKTHIPIVQVSSASPINEVPITLENFDTSSKIISSTPELTTASEQPSSTENELKKIPLEIVTPITPLSEPRKISTVKTYAKPRVTSEEVVTTPTRTRPRGRASRKHETDSSENTSSSQNGRTRSRSNSDSAENVSRVSRARVTRRRLEGAESSETGIKGRGPSVLSTASSQELPTRSRTGRKVTPLQGSSSEHKEVRAAEEKTYTIRSRRIETKTQQLHFESTNDLSKPVSEEKVEVISEEIPSEINRVPKRRRPSHTNTDEVASKANQSRTVTNRNNRNRNNRNRSTEARQTAENRREEARQTTENRRDTGRRRNRKQEERSTPANNINNDNTNTNSRVNVIRSRKPESNVNINQDINEVPITESITTKKITEVPHLEKMSIVESDVLKSESVENRKFVNRFNYEPLGSESTTKGLESTDKQTNSRSRGESFLENKTFENKRPVSRSRPETENLTQKSESRKKEVTTEGILEKKIPTSTVGRRKLQIDESSVAPVNSETTTETKRQKVRTEIVEKNIPKPNPRKLDEIPLAENHIKTLSTLEQKRVNSKIKEERTSTQKVETTDNKRSRGRISDVRRNNRKQEPRSEVRTIPNEANSRRRSQPKASNAVSAETVSRESSTERFDKFRTRHRTRFMPPIIDEQKLEVLPLFESEAKTVRPISDSSERRKLNSVKDDFISASTTEHVVKSATNNEISKGFPHRRGQLVRVETVTEKSEEINIQKRKPIIRESVESEVSEGVSSRQFVSTNKTGSDGGKINKERKVTIKVGTPKVTITEVVNVSRGNKKADIKSTEEADEESDNYPEAFKALIQAKLTKHPKKGSRTRSSAESVTTSSEKVMTSSVIKTTPPSLSTQPSAFSGRVEDVDNELIPKNNSASTTTSIPKSSTRRRFSLSTKHPLTVDAATSSNPLKKGGKIPTSKILHSSLHTSSQGSTENTSFSPKDSRYHARFASEILDKIPADLEHKIIVSTTGTGRSFTPKPTRSTYSTRKGNKKVNGNLRQKARSSKPDLSSVKISSLGAGTPKKPIRYSARYRSDIFSRAGSTRPTPAPVYIPTVPTVTPSSVTQVKSGLAIEENVSGMEVISIDEPVNTIPSDSLVNGELLTPSNPFAPPSNLFPASLVTRNGVSTTAQSIIPKTAEKPVSIIERIIYSITAISSTTAPDVTIDSITNVGPTKSSAIFKIPNKTTKTTGTTDVTFDETLGRQDPLLNQIESSTTEKPTTIIERILSSLSAIQADNSSVPQVGNNVSSISTTFSPIARFTSISSTVSTSLPPVTTPSTDPLVVLEQISSEQSLQERTIAKLLDLLKSITTPKQDDVVIVTPKVTSFVSSTPDTPTIVENPDVEVFNVSSNVITNNPEKQVVPNITTTTDTSANSLTDDSSSPTATETLPTTSTSATLQTENTSPNIAENSIIQEIPPSTETITTEAMSPQNLSSRFSQAISLTDYIASLTAKPETTSSIPATTSAPLQETTSSDSNQSNTNSSDITTLQNTATEPPQVSANSAGSNITEATETNDLNSIDTDTINTGTPNSADQILQVTEVSTESTQAQASNELNTTENDKSNIDADNSTITTELSQTQIANVTEFADTSTKLINSEITVTTEPTQNSENQLQTTEETKIATTTQTSQTVESSQTSAVSAVESGEPNASSQASAATAQSNDTITTVPVNAELPTTTEPTTNPTVQLPTTLSEQLARLMAANLGTPNMVSTTLSIEQTTVRNPITDSDITSTIPQLPTLMNFEVSPGSVTIFSANDISSTFNPIEDGTTVTILSRSFFTTSPPSSEPSNTLETTTVSSDTNLVTVSSNNESVLTTESSLTTSNNDNDSSTEVSVPNTSATAVATSDNSLNIVSENGTLSTQTENTDNQGGVSELLNNNNSDDNVTVVQRSEDISSTENMLVVEMSSENSQQNIETTTTQESKSQNTSASENFTQNAEIMQEPLSQNISELAPVSSNEISENNNTSSQSQSPSIQETTPTLLSENLTSGVDITLEGRIQNLEANVTQEISSQNSTVSPETSGQVLVSNGTQMPSDVLNQNATQVVNENETNVTEMSTETSVENLGTNTTQADLNPNNTTQTSTEISSLNSTENISDSNATQAQQPQMDTNSNTENATLTESNTSLSNRAGKLLEFTDPIQNTLDTSSVAPAKDYFIFAVLPNNTIVRKRPSMYPNKDTPFIIVGVYPNNTVVQKFPNGSLIPEEPIIQVSGFDTRPLPEITSNQVTQPNQESRPDNKILQTADAAAQNTASSVEANQLTVDTTTSQPQPPPVATLPTLTDLLGGKTVQAFNDIINQTNGGDRPNKVQTLDVDPMIQSRARDVEEVNIEENTISSSGNTGPEKIIEATTTPLPPITTRPTSAATPAPMTTEQIITNAPTTTPAPPRPPTTTVPTTIRSPTTTVPNTTRPPTTTAPTTVRPPTTQRPQPPLTTVPITAKPLTTSPPTTLPTMFVQSIRTTLPKTAEDLATNNPTVITTAPTTQSPSALTTQSIMDQTQTPQDVVMAERDVETTPLIDVVTIPPPTLAPRIQETIQTKPTTLITEAVTEPIAMTTPQTFERLRNTMPTTETPSVIQRISKKARNQQRGPTTTPPTTQPMRTRMRTLPTTTVEPTTITIPAPNTMNVPTTTSQPIRTTTIVSRRYTNTPTTVNVPRRRVTTVPPRIRLTTTPTITEQTVISNNYMTPTTTPRIFEASTVFPVYTRPTVDYNSLETTNPPTTKFVTTFRSRGRQTGSTLPPDLTTILTTNQNLERLARLRMDENYGELSTTGDYLTPTTLSPSVSTAFNPGTLQTTLKSINTKVRLLTDQQKKDLEELARLEEEQKAILQQLAFLTKLNLGGGPKPSRSPSNLASRVLDFAAERNKVNADVPPPLNILEALTASNSRESKKITSAEGKNPTVEEVLKQLNVNPNSVTVSSLSSTYGKSTDAILAALLKEQGIGPSTPKSLGDQLKTTTPFEASTTKKVLATKKRTTTPRPGPLMQGLNWLLNALGPQPTTSRRPPVTTRRTTTAKPITAPFDVELLTNQPTEISPVVVTAPPRLRAAASTEKPTAALRSRPKRPLHSLSETELQSLITQLETIQKDPTKAKSLDFSSLKLTEIAPTTTTIIANNAVQITNSGKVGSSSKLQLPSPEITTTKSGIPRSTTGVPLGVSNSILDDAKEETTKPPQKRPNLPPLKLSPVHGVDDEQEPQVRGQLINAAVNVTKAISQFLGSAIQGAAQSFQTFIGSGSRQVGNYFGGSSSSNRPG